MQSPSLVHKFLDVDRYNQRWPLIPPEELHASSVQHPERPEWRWLQHSRRVPVEAPADPRVDSGSCGATPTADDRPSCALVRDADASGLARHEGRTLPHDANDVKDDMYWQDVEDLEEGKRKKAKYDKRSTP